MEKNLDIIPTYGPSVHRVFVGIGRAVDKVPQWHADKLMKVYDSLHTNKLSPQEQDVARATRGKVEKWAKAAGWTATGLETAAVVLGIAKGYTYLKSGNVPSFEDVRTRIRGFFHPSGSGQADAHPNAVTIASATRLPDEVRVDVVKHVFDMPGVITLDADMARMLAANEEAYERILKMTGDPETARGLLAATLSHWKEPFGEHAGYTYDQLRTISTVLSAWPDDTRLHRNLEMILPAGPIDDLDISHFKSPLQLIQGSFRRIAEKLKLPYDAGIPFNFYTATYLPFLHRALGWPVNNELNRDYQWKLRYAMQSFGWQPV